MSRLLCSLMESNHRSSQAVNLLMSSQPLLCMHHLLYKHFTAHFTHMTLLESPDEAKWKWVQRSYDWGRRNHPTTLNYNHWVVLLTCWEGFFFFISLLWRKDMGYVSTPNTTSSSETSALSQQVTWWTEILSDKL